MNCYEDIKNIKGIGEKTAKLFNKLGVFNVDDLLCFYPRTYVSYGDISSLKEGSNGVFGAFKLTICEDFIFRTKGRYNVGSGKATDGENYVNIVYFNAPYFKKNLYKGASYIFYGKLLIENGYYRLEQPVMYLSNDYEELKSKLQPVYQLTKGLSNKTVQKAILAAIEDNDYTSLYSEYLPLSAIKNFDICERKKALRGVHFPKSYDELVKSRKRLAFDELFIFLTMLRELKSGNNDIASSYTFIETAKAQRLLEALPYRLTNAQLRVLDDINQDLTSGKVMNRLVQGDVGSGKTIVAFLSLIQCVENGYQGAMMAPTEILATQHYDNLAKLNKEFNLGLNLGLLIGSMTQKTKKEIYEKLRCGEIDILIGTHALIQEKVEFKNLALVVTDEQHRFGVRQRENLSSKGELPHILVMSATPIPRTLAIVLYGDLHLSVIDEKPSNRLPVKNCVVGPSYRPKAYEFIDKEIRSGRQAYVICPMVEPSEELSNVENVIEYTEKLRKVFARDVRIEYLNGQMKPDEKKRIMDNFFDHNIDILVSTTVIEVGIDVPNSTVMMIENAERFGLSQLHQLRGRIGRGQYQSYCIFLNSDTKNKDNKRLKILNDSNDGFKVAEEDLKLRGAGDIFGIRQSGDMDFKIADIYEDSDLILKINDYIDHLYREDPELALDQNQGLREYLNENRNKFIDFGSI